MNKAQRELMSKIRKSILEYYEETHRCVNSIQVWNDLNHIGPTTIELKVNRLNIVDFDRMEQ